MKKKLLTLSLLLAVFIQIVAQNGAKIPVQGSLYENGESFNGNVSLTFSIPLDNNETWTETIEGINVANGFYSVVLGNTNSLPNNLFKKADSKIVTITVNDTELGKVTIYPTMVSGQLDVASITAINDADGTSDGVEKIYGIYGEATGVGSDNAGVKGVLNSNKTSGSGVEGHVTVSAENSATGFYKGVQGTIISQKTDAVGYGLRGDLSGTFSFATAVRGISKNTNPGSNPDYSNNMGGNFSAWDNPSNNTGVFGDARGDQTGGSKTSINRGVAGTATTINSILNTGLFGVAAGASENIGVYGISYQSDEAPSDAINLAGKFDGDVQINGNLSVSGDANLNLNFDSFELNGEATPNIDMGRKAWETNGTEYPYFRMRGAREAQDLSENGTPYPDLVWIDVQNDGNANVDRGAVNLLGTDGKYLRINTNEIAGSAYNITSDRFKLHTAVNGDQRWATFGLKNNTEKETISLFSKDWETNAIGGYLPAFALRGTQEQTNENGGTYLPDLIWMDVYEDNNNHQIGNFHLRSTNNESMQIRANGIQAGESPYSNGYVINMDNNGGPLMEMNANDTQTISIHGNSGNITISGVLTQSSDKRLKTKIKNLSNVLENIQQVRGVSYQWKDKNKTQKTQVGVIAQEIEKVYPALVTTDTKGMKSVNYAQLTAVLIEAVKELNAKVIGLARENKTLKQQTIDTASLSERISALEKLLISKEQTTEIVSKK